MRLTNPDDEARRAEQWSDVSRVAFVLFVCALALVGAAAIYCHHLMMGVQHHV